MTEESKAAGSGEENQGKYEELYASEVKYSKSLRERAQRAEKEIETLKSNQSNSAKELNDKYNELNGKFESEVSAHAKTKEKLTKWNEYGDARKTSLLEANVQDEDKRKKLSEHSLEVVEELISAMNAGKKENSTSTFQNIRGNGGEDNNKAINPASMNTDQLRGDAYANYVKGIIAKREEK